MTYLAIYYLILLCIALFFLYKAEKSNRIWKDRYWKAQEEIYKLYELKFKECTQQKKN